MRGSRNRAGGMWEKLKQKELFPREASLPEGWVYRSDFISPQEEQGLVQEISRLAFSEVKIHGMVARRRTAHFGWNYEYESWRLTPGEPIPEFLLPYRDRLKQITGVEPAEFGEALVTEYSPGAGINWHRDAPAFGVVAGLSLLAECRMRLRPYPSSEETAAAPQKRTTSLVQTLEPRSVYIMQGPARSRWQHSIPPVKTLRYSITFRTLRNRR